MSNLHFLIFAGFALLVSMSSSDPPKNLTRRCVLGLLGGAGASLLVATPAGKTLRDIFSRLDLEEWVTKTEAVTAKMAGPLASDYRAFLASLRISHVTVAKVLQSHEKVRNGVRNTLPPAHLWKNLVRPLQVADAIGERLGEDVVEVISAYRSQAYNAMCPGSAKFSQHLHNGALDLVFRSAPARVAAAARSIRSEGFFRGGVGLYSGFTHIDARGRNADW